MSLALVNNNKNEIHVDLNRVPTEKEIEEEKAKHEERVKEKLIDVNVIDALYSDMALSDKNLFLFKVRLVIEKKLDELLIKYSMKGSQKSSVNIGRLRYHGLLSIEAEDKLTKVISICNRGVHGELVDDDYITYVEAILEEIDNDLLKPPKSDEGKMDRFVVCTRCGYAGASPYDNFCPKCNFVSDEY